MSKEIDLSASVVTYKNNEKALKRLFSSLASPNLKTKIYVIDNSPTNHIKSICDKEFIYIFNNKNVGFGQGHNIAIKKIIDLSKYHLIINPDIWFEKGSLEKIYHFMEDNTEIGLVIPKVLYPDNSLQHLCRLVPSPLVLLLRKINIPVLTDRQNFRYELKAADYNKIIDAPYVSGCFMFIRNEVFNKVGIFDERFFMYLEDVDLSRRIQRYYRTVYYPEAVVYHKYERGHNNYRLLKYFIFSTFKYFNKWGWFFDKERRLFNNEALRKIKTS